MLRNRVPSVTVAVAREGSVLWEESFGLADREGKVAATPQTPYRLASISKVFTATAVMTLVERGMISLEASVAAYTGDLELRAYGTDLEQATVARVLHHTAGFPMYWETYYAPDTAGVPSLRQTLERYAVVGVPPGERSIYSNIGFGVLEYAIEHVTPQPFATYLDAAVLQPLGLRHTRVLGASPDGETATQYDTDGQRMPFGVDPVKSHGSIAASAHDLMRFGQFHLKQHVQEGRTVLADETIDLMQRAVDPVSAFRLPWNVQDWRGYQVVFFTGATGTILLLVPDEGLVVAVLANRMFANTVQVSEWILGALLPRYETWTPRADTPSGATGEDDARSVPLPSLIGTWEGTVETYEGSVPIQLQFERSGDVRLKRADAVPGTKGVRPKTSPAMQFREGTFQGHFPFALPLTAADRHEHWTWLSLSHHGDTLRGYATAHAADAPLFGLPSYAELHRVVRSGR